MIIILQYIFIFLNNLLVIVINYLLYNNVIYHLFIRDNLRLLMSYIKYRY